MDPQPAPTQDHGRAQVDPGAVRLPGAAHPHAHGDGAPAALPWCWSSGCATSRRPCRPSRGDDDAAANGATPARTHDRTQEEIINEEVLRGWVLRLVHRLEEINNQEILVTITTHTRGADVCVYVSLWSHMCSVIWAVSMSSSMGRRDTHTLLLCPRLLGQFSTLSVCLSVCLSWFLDCWGLCVCGHAKVSRHTAHSLVRAIMVALCLSLPLGRVGG
mmetsp:Transcript_25369/g.62834  ORF Transcript_25369/g.62834 Transcript_25369/m.62834 type:complete len:217 (+) Transcript_25369:267-917(+)